MSDRGGPMRPSRRSYTTTGVIALALALTATACTSSDPAAETNASSSATQSSSASARPTPSPTSLVTPSVCGTNNQPETYTGASRDGSTGPSTSARSPASCSGSTSPGPGTGTGETAEPCAITATVGPTSKFRGSRESEGRSLGLWLLSRGSSCMAHTARRSSRRRNRSHRGPMGAGTKPDIRSYSRPGQAGVRNHSNRAIPLRR